MDERTKERKDRSWIVDIALEMSGLILYIPRMIIRLFGNLN